VHKANFAIENDRQKTKQTKKQNKQKMSKKRERDDSSAKETVKRARKIIFGDDGEVVEESVVVGADLTSTKDIEKKKKKKKVRGSRKRFVLFVGNMPFSAKEKEIHKHFLSAGDIVDIRVLNNKSTGQPRGCAFVEFESGVALNRALKLHHSDMDGRKINVELTAGGGGNSAGRKQKIEQKNKKLLKERRKHHRSLAEREHMLETDEEMRSNVKLSKRDRRNDRRSLWLEIDDEAAEKHRQSRQSRQQRDGDAPYGRSSSSSSTASSSSTGQGGRPKPWAKKNK
jgi:nucleolar protein 6